MLKKWAPLLGFIGLTQAVGISGAWPTSKAIQSGWYKRLKQPDWQPPSNVFAPVWTLLYLMMAVAAWRIWRKRGTEPDAVKVALTLWGAQLALNAAWSWIFFGARKPKFALAEIVALWLAIVATATAFWKIDRTAGALLWPYLAWVSFAVTLNASIAKHND